MKPLESFRPVLLAGAATIAIATAALAAPPAEAPAEVAYPTNYRTRAHVKSMVIEPGHALHASFGGIHHLYANSQALQGYRSGKFPDGAVIVFDLLDAVSADKAVTEGKRKVLGVMQRDTGKYAATGGWGFEGFAGDSKTQRVVGPAAATACFACHQARIQHDYVFSSYRP